MTGRGFSHVSLVTLDLDRTRAFYEGMLGFRVVGCDTIDVTEGGQVRHMFFDAGRNQLLAFLEPRGVPGIPREFDADLNRSLGMPEFFYHFAFDVEGPEALEAKREELVAKGVRVTPVVDHGTAQSIYLKDPNGLMLEYSCLTVDLPAEGLFREKRFEVSLAEPSPFSGLAEDEPRPRP